MTPALSIIMPCFERSLLLRIVLEAYENQAGLQSFEIIAVDDASRDDTAQILLSFVPKRFTLKVILLKKNAGPANARNHGISYASAPVIMFVGDDIVPHTSFVQAHLEAHSQHPQEHWAMLGKTVWPKNIVQNTLMRHIDGLGAQQFSYYFMKDGQEMDFRHFYTSNISLKRALVINMKPCFDTDFRYAAFEDVEFGYRLAKKKGMRIRYIENALAQHYHYYNIWKFSERQYRAGMMAAVFVHKYPHMRRELQFNKISIYSMLVRSPDIFSLVTSITDEELCAIETLALHLASFYESDNIYPLDRLYLLVLNYYVIKGMIDGDLPEYKAKYVRRTLLIVSYTHHLINIIDFIESQDFNRPNDVCISLRNSVNSFKLPVIDTARKIWALPFTHNFRRILGPGYEL